MDNIYQQIVDMELRDLEDKISFIQNDLVSNYTIMDELWKYHPANPDFVNVIKAYDEVKKEIIKVEVQLTDLELKIKHIKSVN
jgi:uncharacterized coiled-coil DUF342 family protein